MHGIRSWEKLTSEGMNFLGHDLIRLLEEVLPGRFGGAATDYQMVETEEAGLPKVDLVISPRVGPVDEHAVIDTTIGFLNGQSGGGFGERWREADTLRVRRVEPHLTFGGKVQALHVSPKA